MKLYFLNTSDVYDYDSDFNKRDPYYIFTDDLSLLKTKCVEKWEDETQSIPYIYQVNTKNLNLLSVNDENVKKILEKVWEMSINEFLEIIEEEGFETAVYDGDFDKFSGISSFQFCDGLTDFPIWDPEKGDFVPKGVLIFIPYKNTDHPTNISEERFNDFVDYLEDKLQNRNGYEITLSLENGDEVELPFGVFRVLEFYDIELSSREGYCDFMTYLKENDNGLLFNEIVEDNSIYDNEEEIKTAIERFNMENSNRYSFGRLLFDIFKDDYKLEYILDNHIEEIY